MCEELDDLQSGLLTYASNGTVSEVTFSCNVGFTMASTSNTLVVVSTAECDENGEWTIPNITCGKILYYHITKHR